MWEKVAAARELGEERERQILALEKERDGLLQKVSL